MSPRRLLATLVAVPVVLLASACQGSVGVGDQPSVSQADLEQKLTDQITQQVGEAPDDLTCPGDLEGTVGTTMTCTLASGEDTIDVDVKVTSVEGTDVQFDYQVADQTN